MPFLKSLTASKTPVPLTWQGGLPFHYHHGPGETTVKLSIEGQMVNKECWNIVGEIPGSDEDEKEWIIGMGNHRDGWTFGGLDPNSGTTAFLEVARILGNLSQNGWTPKRTIQFYSWDSEEWGLIGSTTYAEKYADVLSSKMILYLNLDSAINQPQADFIAETTGGLIDFLRGNDITGKVLDPRAQLPLNQVWDQTVGTLGSGSDYAAFVHHLGVASYMSVFSIGKVLKSSGLYHSKYDDIELVQNFVDPGYQYQKLMAQLYGLLIYHYSDDLIVPFSYMGYLERLKAYSALLQSNLQQQQINLDYTQLNNAISNFENAAQMITEQANNLKTSNDKAAILAINIKLSFAERNFLIPSGLPQRFWFKHVLQAPGLGQGYGHVIFPGVDDALQSGDLQQAQQQVEIIAEKIIDTANFIRGGPLSNTPSPLSTGTIAAIAAAGSVLFIFIIATIYYFTKVKKSTKILDAEPESVSLMKNDNTVKRY